MIAVLALLLMQFPAPVPSVPAAQASAGGRARGVVDWSYSTNGTLPGPGQITATRGGAITFTREASEYCGTSTLYQAAPNTPCVDSSGAGIWSAAAASNLLTASEPGAGWFMAATYAADDAAAPDGTLTATKLTKAASGESNFISVAAEASATISIYLKDGTAGDGVLTLADNSLAHKCPVNLASRTVGAPSGAGTVCRIDLLAGDWMRVSMFVPANPALLNLYWPGVEGTYFWAWRAKVSEGAILGPPVLTAGTPAVGADTVASIEAAPTSSAQWSLGIRATPSGGWGRAGGLGLLQWGTYGANNSASLYVDASSKLILEVYDGAGDWKRWTSTEALSGTSAKEIMVTNAGGTWTVSVGGVAVAGSLSGTGTGVQNAVPVGPVRIGVVGSSVLDGGASKVCVDAIPARVSACLR